MLLKTSLGSRADLPLESSAGVKSIIIGSIRLHCSFVVSVLFILNIQNAVSMFIFNICKKLQQGLFCLRLQTIKDTITIFSS